MRELDRKCIRSMIDICLKVADVLEETDANKANDFCLHYLNCGCRVVSTYLRKGVSEIMHLLMDYRDLQDSLEREKKDAENARNMLEELTGDREFDQLSDEIREALLEQYKASGVKHTMLEMLEKMVDEE